MIDEKGKRVEKPADPVIPPHMLDGFNAAQRKALGIKKSEVEEADKSAEPTIAKHVPKK
jgi:hypothetical protein